MEKERQLAIDNWWGRFGKEKIKYIFHIKKKISIHPTKVYVHAVSLLVRSFYSLFTPNFWYIFYARFGSSVLYTSLKKHPKVS